MHVAMMEITLAVITGNSHIYLATRVAAYGDIGSHRVCTMKLTV